MAIFNFRTRSPERDDATDTRRFDRLARLLNELTDEISVERSGLERRYRSATTDAAFLVEAIENDSVPERSQGQGGGTDELPSSTANAGSISCRARHRCSTSSARSFPTLRRKTSGVVDPTGAWLQAWRCEARSSSARFPRR